MGTQIQENDFEHIYKHTATQTCLILQGNMQGIANEFMKGKDISNENKEEIVYLTDNDGNIYEMTSGGTTSQPTISFIYQVCNSH